MGVDDVRGRGGQPRTHSFFTVACVDPPVVQFTSVGRKDSLTNAEATREFTVSLAAEWLFEEANATATDFPRQRGEFSEVGLAKEPSARVGPPRVAQSPVALECTLHSTVCLGDSSVVFGRVVHAAVADDVLVDGHPEVGLLKLLARLGRNEWSTIGRVLEKPRIRLVDWPRATTRPAPERCGRVGVAHDPVEARGVGGLRAQPGPRVGHQAAGGVVEHPHDARQRGGHRVAAADFGVHPERLAGAEPHRRDHRHLVPEPQFGQEPHRRREDHRTQPGGRERRDLHAGGPQRLGPGVPAVLVVDGVVDMAVRVGLVPAHDDRHGVLAAGDAHGRRIVAGSRACASGWV